jgi:nicotinate phosphoribosyltransferase
MNDGVIKSLLDTDFYKVTMGAVVFKEFSDIDAQYEFINRAGTKFPANFENELRENIEKLSKLRLTPEESSWLSNIPYLNRSFLDWFATYQFDPSELSISTESDQLKITVKGPWYRTIFWEIPLMSLISEIFFRNVPKAPDWKNRIEFKARELSDFGCNWIDFGSRRRFSFEVHDQVVNTMRTFRGFLGTSNPYLAYRYGIQPIGSIAHEFIMAISGLYGARGANKRAMEIWSSYFRGELGIMLSDTFGTAQFIKEFSKYDACLFDGIRQDSGDPSEWMDTKIIPHYRRLNVPLANKKIIFSDNLNVEKYKALHSKYVGMCLPTGGIGTHLTNDCFSEEQKSAGLRPLNMVIKLTQVKNKSCQEWTPVVKLSDDAGKHTGLPEVVTRVKAELGIV